MALATGFDWRGLVSGLSSAIPVYQAQRSARNAQADLEAGQAAQFEKQKQADAMIGDTVSSVANNGPTVPQAHSLAAYTGALQQLRRAPSASIAAVGGDRYKAGVDNAASAVQNYGGRQAFDLSEIDAAARQRESEGYARADLGSKLRTLEGAGDTDLYLAKLKAAREQPNPWLNLLAQLGQRIGRNYTFKNERIDAGSHLTPTTNYGATQTGMDEVYAGIVDPSANWMGGPN
jgi:hypothetical protein